MPRCTTVVAAHLWARPMVAWDRGSVMDFVFWIGISHSEMAPSGSLFVHLDLLLGLICPKSLVNVLETRKGSETNSIWPWLSPDQ